MGPFIHLILLHFQRKNLYKGCNIKESRLSADRFSFSIHFPQVGVSGIHFCAFHVAIVL